MSKKILSYEDWGWTLNLLNKLKLNEFINNIREVGAIHQFFKG